jgi:hypothetical protein
MKKMCLTFSAAVRRLLVLPVGTASVERSYSTLNRILSAERYRLTAIMSDTSCFTLLKGCRYSTLEMPRSSRMPTSNSFWTRRISADRRNLLGECGVNFCSYYCHSSHNIKFENNPLSTSQTVNHWDKWLACLIKQNKEAAYRMCFSSDLFAQFTVLSFVAGVSC